MSEVQVATSHPATSWRARLSQFWEALKIPMLAILVAFALGAIIIWVTSGSPAAIFEAYWG
jgi:ABC-type uncharacterized transport system permease subunit